MKKISILLSIGLFLIIGIYTYRQSMNEDLEVLSISNDIINDYKDIIIKSGNNDEKVIALTFDDGPDRDFTPQVLNNTQQANKKVIGEEPKLFRPPYRAISKSMCNIVKEKDMNIILWSNLDPRDWSNPGVDYIVDTIMSKVQNGTIILLHDYNNLRNKKSQTIQALDIIIPKLKEMGYRFVTVSELINNLEKDKTMQKQE